MVNHPVVELTSEASWNLVRVVFVYTLLSSQRFAD